MNIILSFFVAFGYGVYVMATLIIFGFLWLLYFCFMWCKEMASNMDNVPDDRK